MRQREISREFNLRRAALAACCTAAFIVAIAYAQNPAITITVDANANRHAISQYVYGVAYGDQTTLPDLNCPINRYGGNNTTRYNWQINGDNRGSDWFFESIGDTSAVAGERGDTFISTSKNAGAQSMITIPTVGWVAKLGASRAKLASFSIAKYGAQTGSDFWMPDAGTGVLTNGQDVTGNNPNDANVPSDSTFQLGWMQHIVNRWGPASGGGLRYYILDNEPSIWFATHRDVHPTGATMDEIKNKILDYAARIKATDPSALVAGPEEWGWSGYFFSGFDQQYGSLHGWGNLPDRVNHGGSDYLPWVLDQLRQDGVANNRRLLDIFSLHYYPQSGEFGNDTSTSMQLLRNQSTRSLWDPNYRDQSWINDFVRLIPRMKNWVATYYPGTMTAITEYNWGAEAHINGATTQADILGIFGREGLDIGTRWTTPDPTTPSYKAIKMYRNYDGNKSSFGDASVSCLVPNPDNLSSFAAVRSSDGALTVMVISKVLSGNTPVTIDLSNFAASGAAQVWQLTSANAITRLADTNVTANALTASLPSQSITLFVIPSCASPTPTSQSFAAAGGNGAVSVTASNGCGWTASNTNSWINITSGSSGTGTGAVDYSVGPSTGTAPRSALMMIAGHQFNVLQGADFADVPLNYLFYTEIGKLSAHGITLGCGGGDFCPDQPVTRGQMAAFIIRALEDFNPPTPAQQRFADVPPSNPFYAFIDEMAARGITLGCGGGNFCPDAVITRDQMAAFIIRALGDFNPPPPQQQRFLDVPPSSPFYAFIDQMAVKQITQGCGGGNYCPGAPVTRGQMAAFLVRAFGL